MRTRLAKDEVGDVKTVAGFQYPRPGRPNVAAAHVSNQKMDHQVRMRVIIELRPAHCAASGDVYSGI